MVLSIRTSLTVARQDQTRKIVTQRHGPRLKTDSLDLVSSFGDRLK